MTLEPRQRLRCMNFVHCLLVALWNYDWRQWSPERDLTKDRRSAFHLSVINAYWHLQRLPEAEAIDFQFRVNTDMLGQVPQVCHALNYLVMAGTAFRPNNGLDFELTMRRDRDCTWIWKGGAAPEAVYQMLAREWIDTYTDPESERQWLQLHKRQEPTKEAS